MRISFKIDYGCTMHNFHFRMSYYFLLTMREGGHQVGIAPQASEKLNATLGIEGNRSVHRSWKIINIDHE